jgi:hypothetical protein
MEYIPERPPSLKTGWPTNRKWKVERAIKELQCGKAAGPDSNPPKVFKTGKEAY